jgi:hypothetical protein
MLILSGSSLTDTKITINATTMAPHTKNVMGQPSQSCPFAHRPEPTPNGSPFVKGEFRPMTPSGPFGAGSRAHFLSKVSEADRSLNPGSANRYLLSGSV